MDTRCGWNMYFTMSKLTEKERHREKSESVDQAGGKGGRKVYSEIIGLVQKPYV